jgi:hypothetical protein
MKKLLLILILFTSTIGCLSYGTVKDEFWGFTLRESKAQAIQKAKNYNMTLDYTAKGLIESYMYMDGDLLKSNPNLKKIIVILYTYNNKLIDLYFNFSFNSEKASKNFFQDLKGKYSSRYGTAEKDYDNVLVIKNNGLVISAIQKNENAKKSSVLFSASDDNLIKIAKKEVKKAEKEAKKQ